MQIGEAHADRDRAAGQRFGAKPGADAVGEMMERRFEHALDCRLSSERRLRAGRVRESTRLDLPRIAVPGECRQLASDGVPKQSLDRFRRALSQLTDGGDADRGEPRLGGWTDTPHQCDG
ncbi:MAG: hypothetical protein QM736_17925 [Vicinamibacterales bacterium]